MKYGVGELAASRIKTCARWSRRMRANASAWRPRARQAQHWPVRDRRQRQCDRIPRACDRHRRRAIGSVGPSCCVVISFIDSARNKAVMLTLRAHTSAREASAYPDGICTDAAKTHSRGNTSLATCLLGCVRMLDDLPPSCRDVVGRGTEKLENLSLHRTRILLR